MYTNNFEQDIENVRLRKVYHDVLIHEANKIGAGTKCIDDGKETKFQQLCQLINTSYCMTTTELYEIAAKSYEKDAKNLVDNLIKMGFLVKVNPPEECYRSIHFDLLIRASDTRLSPCNEKIVATSQFALKITPIQDLSERKFIPKKNSSIPVENELYKHLEYVLNEKYAHLFSHVIKEYLSYRGSNGLDLYQANALLEALERWNEDNFVITAPTGAGKTEIFMSLLLIHIINKIRNNEEPNVFIVYPRKMLEIDQMERLILMIKLLNNSFKKFKINKKINVYLRDGDTYKIKHEFEETGNAQFRGIKCFANNKQSGKLVIKKGKNGEPKVVCQSENSLEDDYEFVIPFKGIKNIDYKNINIVITNINTLLYRTIAIDPVDVDLHNILQMNLLIMDEIHEYNPVLLGYIHYLVKSIKLLKNEMKDGKNTKLKIVLSSATLGNHNIFIKKLLDSSNIVDLSYDNITKKKNIQSRGQRATLYSFILIQPQFSWQTYLSEYIAFLDFLHYVYKKNGKGIIPQAIVFINNIRELNRTRDVVDNAIQLGSPLDNLCVRQHMMKCCKNKNPKNTKYVFSHYKAFIDNTMMKTIEHQQTLYDYLSKLNDIIYSQTPLNVRNKIAELLKKKELACVLATSSLELGVDYPGVSIIINTGFDKEASLIQRIGRGGRDISTLNTTLAIILARNNPLDHRQFFDTKKIQNIVQGQLDKNNVLHIAKDLYTLKYLAILRMALTMYSMKTGTSGTKKIAKLSNFKEFLNSINDIIKENIDFFSSLVDKETVTSLLNEMEIIKYNLEDYVKIEDFLNHAQQRLNTFIEIFEELQNIIYKIFEQSKQDKQIAAIIEKLQFKIENAYDILENISSFSFRAGELRDINAFIKNVNENINNLCRPVDSFKNNFATELMFEYNNISNKILTQNSQNIFIQIEKIVHLLRVLDDICRESLRN